MELDDLRSNWERLGDEDPYWAILTDPRMIERGWESHLDAFFESGRHHVTHVLEFLDRHGLEVARGQALDFGCGVGRVTEALADHFAEVVGVDVAASMISRAEELSTHPDTARYVTNTAADLRILPDASVDLVHTVIVLQHMVPALMEGYIAEFLRVLRPGGVAVFQVPARHQPVANMDTSAAGVDRATVRIVEPPTPVVVEPGRRFMVRAVVTNVGTSTWNPEGSGEISEEVRVGNHWRNAVGGMVRNDDGRTRVPGPVAPGDEVTVEIPVEAPSDTGGHILELDVVREGWHWFAEVGSDTTSISVTIDADPGPSSTGAGPSRSALKPAPPAGPVMEMYALAETDVVEVVEAHGGQVVLLQRDGACGPDWRSWTYYAVKH